MLSGKLRRARDGAHVVTSRLVFEWTLTEKNYFMCSFFLEGKYGYIYKSEARRNIVVRSCYEIRIGLCPKHIVNQVIKK